MSSVQAQKAAQQMRVDKKAAPVLPLDEARLEWDKLCAAEPIPQSTETKEVTLGGVACEEVTNTDAPGERRFVLLHGGCYDSGNFLTHRKLAAHLSQALACPVIVPDYRLAPEHPFPAAVQDARAVYDALLENGMDANQIVLGGDSAGGGLALALLLDLRDDGANLPRSAVLLSPWTDITCSGTSYESNRQADPGMITERLRDRGLHYVGDADPADPKISPIGADLVGLPPLLIHVGGDEIMLDDSTIFAERAKAAGVDVTLEVWEGMWHVWHNQAPEVPESVEAIRRVGEFVRGH